MIGITALNIGVNTGFMLYKTLKQFKVYWHRLKMRFRAWLAERQAQKELYEENNPAFI